jgi:phosphopantetheinyl transferase
MIPGHPADVTLRLIEHNDDEVPTWESWLTEEERRCVASFGHPERRTSFVMGRAAARLAAAAYLGRTPESIEIEVADSGAVKVGGEDLFLSIAHSGSFAAAAVFDCPVGVDLEMERDVPPKLFDRIGSSSDQLVLTQLGLPNAALACWTLKEAVLKGMGTGLRLAPHRLSLSRRDNMFAIQTPTGVWQAVLQVSDDRYLAVAWKTSDS